MTYQRSYNMARVTPPSKLMVHMFSGGGFCMVHKDSGKRFTPAKFTEGLLEGSRVRGTTVLKMPYTEFREVMKTALKAHLERGKECKLVLTRVGPKKVLCIKAIRSITGLGLKEAKALADDCGIGGSTIITGTAGAVEAWAAELMAHGSTAEIMEV
jgi:ribosomal protein L7/L12